MAQFNAEDFSIFQTQLLDLREKNYALEDKLKKQSKECSVLSEQCTRQAVAIRASKKATEADALNRDNNLLRTRLQDQEEEFKLQNSTLLQELARLVAENERLEEQLTALCTNHSTDAPSDASTDDSKQVLMLRTEVSLLQKRLERQAEEHTKLLDEQKHKLNCSLERNTELQQLLSRHALLQEEGAIKLNSGGVSFKKLGLEEHHSPPGHAEEVNTLPAGEYALKLRAAEEQLREASSAAEALAAQVAEAEAIAEKEKTGMLEVSAALQSEQERVAELQSEVKKRLVVEEQLKEEISQIRKEKDEADLVLLQTNEEKQLLQEKVDALQESLTKEKKCVERLEGEVTAARQQVEQARLQCQQQLKEHREQQERLQVQVSELKEETAAGKSLRLDVAQLEREKSMAQERAAQLEDEVASLKEFWQVEKEQIEAENLALTKHLQEQAAHEKQAFTTELEISSIQKQELEDKIADLQKQVSDAKEERRIHERRGASLLKDLKKQLSAEHRRADKLQDKLAQVLADPSTIAGFSSSVSDVGDDVSSVSSWSMVSGDQRAPDNLTQHLVSLSSSQHLLSLSSSQHLLSLSSSQHLLSLASSEHLSPSHSSNKSECCSDTSELLARVAALQSANWQKEEQLQHLEASAAAMAQDLITKSTIIQHYCINVSPSPRSTRAAAPVGGGDTPSGVRKVLSRLREVGEGVAGNVAEMATGSKEEASREMNRRLQALLEETLLKNINLHRDVDLLTQQVQQLTALATAQTPTPSLHEGQSTTAPASCTTSSDGSTLELHNECDSHRSEARSDIIEEASTFEATDET
ncbi:hypothetical protein FHG87_004413 [Trinorchestia longiramus]|nr:hypothetical protein FHG87_004413 [Trinorchestia longiramus]